MKELLAGPWLGEWGWELMAWVPYLRAISRRYDRTIVVCRERSGFLYEDFAQVIERYDRKGKPDRWLWRGRRPRMPRRFKRKYPHATIKSPNAARCYSKKRKYHRYGTKREECAYDLVIHARAITKYGQRRFNWPKPRYRKVLEELKLNRVCSIGTKAHWIEGTEDMRSIPLAELCDILASSKVLLTPSSGPGHLAHLCGCPHVIMTSDKYQPSIGSTNKNRYLRSWAPFKTPCKVLDDHSWQPPVEKVVKALKGFL